MTVVGVYDDLHPIGVMALADSPRAEAREAVAAVRSAIGRSPVLLTGDHAPSAHAIARDVGISEVHARLLPDQKLGFIHDRQAEGYRVAMIGDGINDAPALAGADLGIAMGVGGADLSVQTADVALLSDNLALVAQVLSMARLAVRRMRQNLVLAVATALFLIGGVLAGQVHMAGGMLVHQLSILVVIANGLRGARS